MRKPKLAAAMPVAALVFTVASVSPLLAAELNAHAQIVSYGELVYRNYTDAYQAVLKLQQAVDDFVADPADDADEVLNQVRQAWLDSRFSYGETEAFRFYEGPIDFGKRPDGTQGPEGLINAWPLNEAYIDAVQGNSNAGIINDPNIPITREALIKRNASDDEADVTTGYHAIEFLLWGQDFNADGPGNRSARDFVGAGAAARRRTYLKVATDLLVEQLHGLVVAWAPHDKHNYRAQFEALDARDSISKILTGLATLSGFELGYERLATALDSGSQEDEQSCFSDSTAVDIVANVTGVANVYFGRYGDYQGAGIDTLVAARHPALNELLKEQLTRSLELASAIDRPFDKTVATPPGSPQRAKVEALITSLQTQTRLLKQAGVVLGVPLVVAVEYD
jgi:putative iron-regulated protein